MKQRELFDELVYHDGRGEGCCDGVELPARQRSRALSFDTLRRIGVVLKRARHFITASLSFLDRPDDPARIRRLLSDAEALQPLLFEF